jgi:serine phosphatase RsbU (regulator of sigma subunit)
MILLRRCVLNMFTECGPIQRPEMIERDNTIDLELRKGAQFTARHLAPEPGAVPRIPGIDIYGVTIPLNGIVGGDLITYVNYQDRFDLDARIQSAAAQGQDGIVRNLQGIRRTGGILVADVAGHEFVDAMRALMLHQALHTGALYEMDANGEITVRLFEQINTRFLKSMTLRNLASDQDSAAFLTLIYGEISQTGRFRFISAGHPAPLIYSCEYDRFVEISPDRLVAYPPIGLMPAEDHADVSHFDRTLGYKKRYALNELNLMGRGDILLLYTDGLIDPFSTFTQKHAERIVSRARNGSAQEICCAILGGMSEIAEQSDDLTLVVIKRN